MNRFKNTVQLGQMFSLCHSIFNNYGNVPVIYIECMSKLSMHSPIVKIEHKPYAVAHTVMENKLGKIVHFKWKKPSDFHSHDMYCIGHVIKGSVKEYTICEPINTIEHSYINQYIYKTNDLFIQEYTIHKMEPLSKDVRTIHYYFNTQPTKI